MTPAFATNGYFSHGYGIKSKGMAGVGIAYGQDALAAATNPANMVLVGNRWDVGVDYFRPQRETEVTSAFGASAGTYDGNATENFFIPEFGYNQMINANSSFGVSVYGNGGMNTDYGNINNANIVCANPPTCSMMVPMGSGNAGVDLMQLFIAPTYSMKINPQHSIGVSLNIAYQRFKAYGIQNFDNSTSSSAPGSVSNNGYDDSWGYGARIGWTGQLTPTFALAATYQTETYMQEFDKYKGLFAEQGGFNIPANYGIGFAWKAMPALTIAGDIQVIQYGDIKSIANKMTSTAQLGTDSGSGFGWDDITVYKLGVSYDVNQNLTLRGGYSITDEPYGSDQTFFNILAPAVVTDHLTLGATWKLQNNAELSFAYMHAFENTVNGTGNTAGLNNRMYQDSFGVAYGAKF
jgi:long-chain fatty acid transport protein